VLASNQGDALGIAVDAKNVYWATHGDGFVLSAPIGGGAPVMLASGQTGAYGVAVDDQYVYWTIATTNGELRRVPIGGGEVVTLAVACDRSKCPSAPIDVSNLLVADGTIFWTTATDIVKVAK
jgi:hypothetical protein